MRVIHYVGHASRPHSAKRDRGVEAPSLFASGEDQAGINREDVAGPPEAIAAAEQVCRRHTLAANPSAPDQSVQVWEGHNSTSAIDVLIGYRHDVF